MIEYPETCPYCGRKLKGWQPLTINHKNRILCRRECKKCKVEWRVEIKPEALVVREVAL